MNIDLKLLALGLMETEEEKTFPLPPINPYVLRHIYEPLLRDETVRFSELNYAAFDDSDLTDLETMLDDYGDAERRLVHLNELLCSAPPVSASVRAFC